MKTRVKEYVKFNQLDKPDRHREKNYQRIILAKILREEGMPLQRIGEMMHRNHATIINMMKNYEWLKNYSDFRKLEQFVLSQLNIKSLEERIIDIKTLSELKELQEEIKKSLNS